MKKFIYLLFCTISFAGLNLQDKTIITNKTLQIKGDLTPEITKLIVNDTPILIRDNKPVRFNLSFENYGKNIIKIKFIQNDGITTEQNFRYLYLKQFKDTSVPIFNDLATLGYLNGYKDGTLKPFENITKKEATSFLIKAIDVVSNKPVESAIELGIINKTNLNKPLNRAEAITMLCRANKITLVNNFKSKFSDVSEKAWFYPYICTAESLGWLDSFSGTFFLPSKPISRSEFINLTVNTSKLKDKINYLNDWENGYAFSAYQPKVLAQDLISLSFDNMEVSQVLQLLARQSGLNIVLAENIRGKISGHFNNIYPETALANIISLANCKYTLDGSLYKIYKTSFEKNPKNNNIREFKLSYAQGDTVIKELAKLIPSLEGKVILMKETNTILINSRHPQLGLARDIIQSLDVPPLQVMVEAKIFEISAEESSKLGSKFIGTEHNNLNSKTFETLNLEPADRAIYIRSVDRDVQAYISTLESHSDINMLSAPKVIVVNNREALLETTEEVAYQDETVSFTTSGEVISKKLIFKNIGTKLKLIPHINEKGFISIDLYPEISSSVPDTATNYPLVYTTKAHTQVVVADGETFLIGGLLRDKKEKIVKKVPVLGDIPLLGLLFKRTEEQTVKKDIIIMITPTIINPFNKETK